MKMFIYTIVMTFNIVCVCVCVCVCVREGERESVCVCVCEHERVQGTWENEKFKKIDISIFSRIIWAWDPT